MKLVIGGYAQGKLAYVLENYKADEAVLWDGALREAEPPEKLLIVNHLECYVREQIAAGREPEAEVLKLAERHPDCIFISDEVGNGIVPMEQFEREYRERLGRLLIVLAKEADEVVRVICGIGQKIK